MMTGIGVIGAGNWGRNHVRTLHSIGALAGVAEVSADLRGRVLQEFPGTTTFSDHAELLKTAAKGVVIATPASTHHRIAREALLAGKDVLIEKPMTLTSKEADDLVELARASGRVLMVGHLLLYQPAVQLIAREVRDGRIGELRSLHQERLNLGKVRVVENALWSLGVHDIAVLLALVGAPPLRVRATGQRAIQPGVEDDVHLHMEFPGNVHAHLHASWLWPERRRRLTLIGTKGMLVYDEIAQTVTFHAKGIAPDLSNRDEGTQELFRGEAEPLRLELQHFIDRTSDRGRPISDGEQGAAVIRVLEAATQGMERA